MKTIDEFVQQGIKSPDELKDALYTAMRLEFSTLPPYLCAEWSIKENDDNDVEGMIHDIIMQEMYHFALAGNILAAVGGAPHIADRSFLPTYPTHELPGGIRQQLAVDLLPLSPDQLKVFMQIESPEFTPVDVAARFAAAPATIGEFYTTLSKTIETQAPAIDANAHFVNRPPEVFPIRNLQDALDAIERIKSEGEGTPGKPDQPLNPGQLAHYYVFKQISIGNVLDFDAALGKLVPVPGKPIRFPSVYSFQETTLQPNPSEHFNDILKQMLVHLEEMWTGGASLQRARQDMMLLKAEGIGLIERGIRPEFGWPASP